MTDVEIEEDLPPVAHVTIVYTGPIAPHWELNVRYGDQKLIDDFWARVNARLLLLPKHDPQFRRNKERVNRDAERERIVCDWDLGEDDADTTITPVAEPAPVATEPEPEPGETEPASVVEDHEPEAVEASETEAAEVEGDGGGDAPESDADAATTDELAEI